MDSKDCLDLVREQYENYPYPERNPEDEKFRLYSAGTDCLDKLNYYCYEGKRNFDGDFRVLIAGGGTGDSTIFLAEQFRNTKAEIVHLDISLASMEVAKKRAMVRGLDNIIWRHESLLDLPRLGIGKFDYINCSGVLHHLDDPQKGLSALNAVLSDDGAMSIMVYAKYGRTSVYQIQELMRIINQDESDMRIKIENCRSLLADLPDSNWIAHSKRIFPEQVYEKPIELYDLFLHSQDRAYSIPELYDYVAAEGLEILQLLPSGDQRGNDLYNPESYITDKAMRDHVTGLSLRDRQAIAELMHGLIPKHTCYVAKYARKPPSVSDLSNIPYLGINFTPLIYGNLLAVVRASEGMVTLNNQQSGFQIEFPKSVYTESVFGYLDGYTPLRLLFRKIISSAKFRKHRMTIPVLTSEFKKIFDALQMHNLMFLRNEAVKHPVTISEMEARVAGMCRF